MLQTVPALTARLQGALLGATTRHTGKLFNSSVSLDSALHVPQALLIITSFYVVAQGGCSRLAGNSRLKTSIPSNAVQLIDL
jgi:hypothetical protein